MVEPLRLALTGGGTGGHVSPILAVLVALRQRLEAEGRPLDLLWLGSEDGVERAAAEQASIPYAAIPAGKLRRYLTPLTIRDAARVPLGLLVARRWLACFQPHVLFSTGGFVSVPPVLAARWLGIPSLTHEQTVTVGLANRINARFATRIALAYAASAAWLPAHPLLPEHAPAHVIATPRWRAPIVITGNPVRPELLAGDAARGRAYFNFAAALPVVYLTGGARGSHALNTVVAAALPQLLQVCQLVHQTGPTEVNGDLPRLEMLAADLPAELQARYRPCAFVGPELPDLFALAALIVGRAGAGTLTELAALGKPSLLIPLPGASADEQTRNARLLADAGAAVLLPEADLTPERLVSEITMLLSNPPCLHNMGQAVRQFARPQAAEQIVGHLLALADPSRHL